MFDNSTQIHCSDYWFIANPYRLASIEFFMLSWNKLLLWIF
jgi:hypothetical protein